jgi:hypothetical protein
MVLIRQQRMKRGRTCVFPIISIILFRVDRCCQDANTKSSNGAGARESGANGKGAKETMLMLSQAADYHEEDHPDISAYLRSLDPSAASTATGATADADADNAVSRVDAYTSSQADALIEETQRVMAEAAARGEDPEAALKEIV